MNRILWEPGEAGSESTELPFDWAPDLERLESAAKMARETNQADPWTLPEAECWLDLIDAELIATGASRERADRTRQVLQDWRSRVGAVIGTLRDAEARSPSASRLMRREARNPLNVGWQSRL